MYRKLLYIMFSLLIGGCVSGLTSMHINYPKDIPHYQYDDEFICSELNNFFAFRKEEKQETDFIHIEQDENYSIQKLNELIQAEGHLSNDKIIELLYQHQKQIMNPKRTFDYLMYRSQNGDANAQILLGQMYLYQFGYYENAVSLLQCAAMKKPIIANQQLATATLIYEKNPPKALQYHIKAGNAGSIKSIMYLKSVFRDGQLGYAKDLELSRCFNYFIIGYRNTPEEISELEKACPLPDHPDKGNGTQALTDEDKLEIAKMEKNFNPERKINTTTNNLKDKALNTAKEEQSTAAKKQVSKNIFSNRF